MSQPTENDRRVAMNALSRVTLVYYDDVEVIAQLIADEREACEKIAERAEFEHSTHSWAMATGARHVKEAIRAKSQTVGRDANAAKAGDPQGDSRPTQ